MSTADVLVPALLLLLSCLAIAGACRSGREG